MMSGEPKCEVRSRRRTEDAHEVLSFADLLEKRFVAFIEARLLLAVDFSRAPMHGVDDGLQAVKALHGKPLHHPPTERGRANVHQVRQRPPEDGEVVQRRPALVRQHVPFITWNSRPARRREKTLTHRL